MEVDSPTEIASKLLTVTTLWEGEKQFDPKHGQNETHSTHQVVTIFIDKFLHVEPLSLLHCTVLYV